MTERFLRNAWYAAMWADELAEAMSCKQIIGEPILLYRDAGGVVRAMDNICPHRYAPLHQGELIAGNVRCPYHGLELNSEGKCVRNPNGNQHVPGRSDLRTYPVVERHALVWIWMGDPTQADEATIPDFSCHTASDMKMVKGTLTIDAFYELVTDNLMDLTHAVTVHADCLGSEAIARGVNTVLQDGTTVWSNSWCADGLAPKAWDAVFGHYGKNVDHWLNMRWDAPGNMLLDAGITPTGKSRGEGIWVYGTDILTPVSERRTRYFWAIARNHHVDDPRYDDMWFKSIKHAFEGQDKPMIEAQQQMLDARGLLDIEDTRHAAIATEGAEAADQPGR